MASEAPKDAGAASGAPNAPAAVRTASGQPPLMRRRSPRLEELANAAPTLRQLAEIDARERFVHNVSPRMDGATDVVSPRRPRTRAEKLCDRKKRSSPHVPESTSAAEAATSVSSAQEDDEGSNSDVQDDSEVEDVEEEAGSEEEEVEEEEEEEEASDEEAADASEHSCKDTEGASEEDRVESMADHAQTMARQNTAPAVELSAEPVRAPPLQEFHADWDAWLAYEVQYSEETHQVLSIALTLSAQGYYTKTKKHVKPKPHFPEELTPYNRVYICTHGNQPKNTGTGVRPQRWVRYTGCLMRFTVQWTHHKKHGWRLQVLPRVMVHNHVVGPQVYRTYPVARGIKDADNEERGRDMVSQGISRAKIYSFFLDRGENVYKVDVDNFINASRARISTDDDNTATAIVLARLANSDPGCVIEMQSVLSMSTPFVAKIVEPQYTAAVNKFDAYVYEDSEGGEVVVKGKTRVHKINTVRWTCNCDFSETMLLPCRHIMAYRRHKGFPEMIPLARIDVRWKRATCAPVEVQQLLLNEASKSLSPSRRPPALVEADPVDPRTRYNEAMRRLIPICSELAEIEDREEFEGYMKFLEEQFRNVRKRKRTGQVSELVRALESTDSPTSAPHVELSQANSLWSAEVGDVPAPALDMLRIPRPADLIEGDDMEIEHGLDMAGHGEDMEAATSDATQPDQGVHASDIRVALNENTAKSGRPRLDKKAVIAAQRQDRVLFKETEKARKKYGELTLEDVVRGAETEQLAPAALRKRLAGVRVRHEDAANKRPVYQLIRKPTLNQNAYYVLPSALLKACIKQLPVATRPGEVIRLSTPEPGGPARASPKPSGGAKAEPAVECITIKDVGIFSRAQVELMCRVVALQKAAKKGEEFVTWLRNDVASAVSVEGRRVAKSIADELERLYPFAPLPDLPSMPDYDVRALYKLKNPDWVGDGLMAAFCDRLARVYAGVRYVGFVSGSKKKGRGTVEQRLEASIIKKLKQLAAEDGVTTLLLPVNFGEWHWTAIYFDLMRKTINYYDSKEVCFGFLGDLVSKIQDADTGKELFADFTRVRVKNPYQQDGFSCGVFVLHKFWRYIDNTVSKIMTPNGLYARRLEILHLVLRSEKIHANLSEEGDDDDKQGSEELCEHDKKEQQEG